MLRLFHTSDWHLGHRLHGISRHYEQQCFLDWLLSQLQSQQADALIVAGDIFDTANPSAAALSQFYDFVALARQTLPALDMVFIGGNHDSASRLDAPAPIMQAMRVSMVGAIPLLPNGDIRWDDLLIPLTNKQGDIQAYCAAMPFLRHSDLARVDNDQEDALIHGVKLRYEQLFTAALLRQKTGQALLTTGHCYMVNSQISELSERRILGGNQHALPVDMFPDYLNYVALGHMHKAQKVGGHEHIRYSGSPIPLSFNEAKYPHQVIQVDFEQGIMEQTNAISVPTFVPMIRLPAASLQEQLRVLKTYEWDDSLSLEQFPLLEVAIHLTQPEPTAAAQIQDSLKDKPVRLLKITKSYQGSHEALADQVSHARLQDMTPQEVFVRCYQREYNVEPSDLMQEKFDQLLEQVYEEKT